VGDTDGATVAGGIGPVAGDDGMSLGPGITVVGGSGLSSPQPLTATLVTASATGRNDHLRIKEGEDCMVCVL
jgi:hypothetical protein